MGGSLWRGSCLDLCRLMSLPAGGVLICRLHGAVNGGDQYHLHAIIMEI